MKAWIARDEYGGIDLYLDKRNPQKDIDAGMWYIDGGLYDCIAITDDDLPEGVNPQWSDDEPIEVELTIENIKH